MKPHERNSVYWNMRSSGYRLRKIQPYSVSCNKEVVYFVFSVGSVVGIVNYTGQTTSGAYEFVTGVFLAMYYMNYSE